jgi:hypothetical protein
MSLIHIFEVVFPFPNVPADSNVLLMFDRNAHSFPFEHFRFSELNLAQPSEEKIAIYFYSAFFTSLWLWLYVLAGFSITLARRICFIWVRVSRYLDIDKKPLGCIGKVGGLVLATLWTLLVCAEHVVHYLQGK